MLIKRDKQKNSIMKNVLVMMLTAAIVISGLAVVPQKAYAAGGNPANNGKDISTLQADETAGLVIMGANSAGEKISGNKGFGQQLLYFSNDQVEAIKSSESVDGLGLGNSYIKGAEFSSYENHGTGTFHYSKVNGLEIDTMLDAVVPGGMAMVSNYFVIADDGYTQNMATKSLAGLKYYAPGTTEGIASPNPIIALYKTANVADDQSSGTMPLTAERLAKGESVFMFGQSAVKDSNNCKFLKGANVISANNLPIGIKSNSTNDAFSLIDIIEGGSYKTDYSFEKEGSIVTHKVEGVPFTQIVSDFGLSKFMPSYATNKIQIQSADGTTKTVAPSDINKCFIAWNYTDDMETPSKQTGDYAIYMPGTTEDQVVAYNVTKVSVVDSKGEAVKTVPEKPQVAKTAITKLYKSGKIKKGKGSVVVKWKKISGATGYNVVYGTNSKMTKGKKTITIKNGSTVSKTITKLTKNKRYYVKVRAYKVINGQTYYGAYSTTKSIKR